MTDIINLLSDIFAISVRTMAILFVLMIAAWIVRGIIFVIKGGDLYD